MTDYCFPTSRSGSFFVTWKIFTIFALNMRRLIVILFLSLTVALAVGATQRWEEVDALPGIQLQQDAMDEDSVVVTVSDGYIYVSSEERLIVRVFSILGQLISREELPGGTYRFRMRSRGIYVVKIGTRTIRVTI